MNEDHDILIELKTDVKYIRESVDETKRHTTALWKKTDEHGDAIAGIKESNRGLWVVVSTLLGGGGLVGLILWFLAK